jgi:hypothetical protein
VRGGGEEHTHIKKEEQTTADSGAVNKEGRRGGELQHKGGGPRQDFLNNGMPLSLPKAYLSAA